MLSEEDIRLVLHASCVLPLSVAKPHGPLGLAQLAAAASRVNPALGSRSPGVCRPIALDPYASTLRPDEPFRAAMGYHETQA